MKIFGDPARIVNQKVDDKRSEKNISNIISKPICREVRIQGDSCRIYIQDAKFGTINGREVMLDEELVNQTIHGISRVLVNSSSRYNPIPKKIVISQEPTSEPDRNFQEEVAENDRFLEIYSPRWGLDSLYIEEQAKKQIMTTITMAKYKDTLFQDWGLQSTMASGRAVVLNFWGPPGTGKSMGAEAIANYLGKQIYSVNYAELESKYVGETPKNIKKAFQKASENNAVLVFDEADSFLGKRLTDVTHSADYGVNITRSVMLLEIEKFDGVVIFTTNLVNNYDEAFKRRIMANIEFRLPDEDGRRKIWAVHLPLNLPLDPEVTPELLSRKFLGISGADIKDIILYAAVICLEKNCERVQLEHITEAYHYVIKKYQTKENVMVSTEVITEEQYKREAELFD